MMRMMLEARFPNEPFNRYVHEGTLGRLLDRIMETLRPEAAYFTERDGHRCGLFIVNVESPSKIPVLAEPLFLALNARVHLAIVISPDELGKANVDSIGKQWT